MHSLEWSPDWPVVPGLYWFYGWKFKRWPVDDPARLFVVIVSAVTNGSIYVVDGHFMWPEEGAKGWWLPLPTPRLPDWE